MDKQQTKKGQLGKAFIRSAPQPASFNQHDMTMDLVFSAGTKGLRSSWFGDYFEELSMDPAHVRLDRLQNGAPVLADHMPMLENVIGVVESAYIDNGQGIARVRFSKDEASAAIVQKIRDGIIRKVSVGYFVYRYEEFAAPEGQPPTYRAVDWEPVEVSFVAIPFDDKAQSRSGEQQKVECELVLRNLGEKMDPVKEEVKPEDKKEEVVAAPAAEPKKEEAPKEEPKKEEEAPKPDAEAKERSRASGIMKAVRTAGLDQDFALKLVESNKTLEQAQDEIHQRWVEKGKSVEINNRVETKELGGVDHIVRGVTNALLHRADASKNQLTEEGREFRGFRMTRLAALFLKEAGYKTDRMSDYDIAKKALSMEYKMRAGAHGTSDFPSLLADVANKTLLNAYQATPQSFRPFTRAVTTSDFKNVNRVRLGEAPSLELVGEHGEVTYGSLSDNKELYALKTYAKGLKLTRQAMINDDTDAFSRLPQLMGAAVSRLESDIVYAILTANAAMSDSVALFNSAHENLGTPGAIGETTLSEMRKFGRLQTGLDGVELLNIIHKYIIVPAALETALLKQIGDITPALSSSVNVFSKMYTPIVEPRLDGNSATAWYAAADYSQVDTLEIMTLEGQSAVPQIDSEMEFDTLAVKMKVVHDVAAKAIDHRGLFKNAGQ